MEDNEEASDYGITLLPALVYFENRIPSLYDEDLSKVRLSISNARNTRNTPFGFNILETKKSKIAD